MTDMQLLFQPQARINSAGSVYEAVKNGGEELHSFDALHKLHELTGVPVPEKMLQLENMPVLHKEVIEPENMAEAVKNSI